MEDNCSLCNELGRVFETRQPGIWACEKCIPLSPEVSISVDAGIVALNNSPSYQDESSVSSQEPQPIMVGGKFKCNLCNKTFDKTLQYQNHVRNHTAEKKYTCTFCSKAFSQSNNLRAHLRIHTNERPYKCSLCDKAFTQVTNLNNHIRLHTGEKPYICPAPGCDKAFAQVTNLNQHKKTHEKISKYNYTPIVYSCNPCGHVFSTRKEQLIHKRDVHGDLRPITRPAKPLFPCAICDECFTTKKLHDKHVAEHVAARFSAAKASVLVIPCPLKECTYVVEGSLEAHMERYHGHGGDEKLKCPFKNCMRYFPTTEERNTHITSDHFGPGGKSRISAPAMKNVEFVSVGEDHFENDKSNSIEKHNNKRNSSKKSKNSQYHGVEVPVECEIVMDDEEKR